MNQPEAEIAIKVAVRLAADCIGGKPLSPARVERYVQQLVTFRERPALWRVLDRVCDEDRMPSPPSLAGMVHAELARLRPNEAASARHLDGEARSRADEAAISSMLWLYLVKKKPAAWFEGSIFARLLKRKGKLSVTDIEAFFQREIDDNGITAASIDAWMRGQIAMGN